MLDKMVVLQTIVKKRQVGREI